MQQTKSNVRVMAEVPFRYERGDLLTYRFLAEIRCDPPTAFQLGFPVFGSDPTFDRSKAKGLVATLITLNEKYHAKSTALEISAGAKLYNVVMENKQVGKELLQHGKLKKRVTNIPLNKTNAFRASAQKLTAAKKIGGEKVNLALSLVGYEEKVANAMTFVFGDTLICDDSNTAKAVTFNSAVGLKSVTLDGDVYDPSGTLSGGSAPSSSGLLVKV